MESSLNNEIFCHYDTNNALLSTFVDKKEEIVPQLPIHLVHDNIIYYDKSPQELYNLVLQIISEMKGKILKEKPKRFKIYALFKSIIQPYPWLSEIEFCFYIYIYTCPKTNEELSVLYLQRRFGDMYEYQEIYKLIFDKVSPISMNDLKLLVESKNKNNSDFFR